MTRNEILTISAIIIYSLLLVYMWSYDRALRRLSVQMRELRKDIRGLLYDGEDKKAVGRVLSTMDSDRDAINILPHAGIRSR